MNQEKAPEPSANPNPPKVYPITTEMGNRIENNFMYHSPKFDQFPRYETIRREAKSLAQVIVESTPPSREQSEALTCIESAVMWANAAIARNE